MSLSDDAVSLPSQIQLLKDWKRNPEPWQHEAHAVLREWADYAMTERLPSYADLISQHYREWVGGQFFYPHWLVDVMTEDHRQWAEQLALSIRGGSRAAWIEHASCWEVRAVL